jgi:CheY-like chemotaxis protein
MSDHRSYNNLKTVLVVEDNDLIRKVTLEYLDSLGLHSIACSDGLEAISVLKTEEVDLIITDFQMPRLDGVGLLDWCRTHGIHVPVIFVSASANLIKKEQVALNDCCATLMSKPINLDVFIAAIGAADSRSHHKDCLHFRNTPVEFFEPTRL